MVIKLPAHHNTLRLRPNPHRTQDVTHTHIWTFFLWCCLCAVWTLPFTSTGLICLRRVARRIPRPVWIGPDEPVQAISLVGQVLPVQQMCRKAVSDPCFHDLCWLLWIILWVHFLWKACWCVLLPFVVVCQCLKEQNEWQRVLFSGGKPPKDSTTVVLDKEFVSTEVLIVVGIFSLIGIIMALGFLAVNIIHRDKRYITTNKNPHTNKNVVALRAARNCNFLQLPTLQICPKHLFFSKLSCPHSYKLLNILIFEGQIQLH